MSSSSHADGSSGPHPSLRPYLDSEDFTRRALTIVVVGASGHLARTQVIPAIFSLFCKRLLPQNFHLVGYARTEMDSAGFRGSTLEKGLHGHESHEVHNMGLQHDMADEKSQVRQLLSFIGLSSDSSKNNNAGERVTESDRTLRRAFLERCSYMQGQYDKEEDYRRLKQHMEGLEEKNEEDGGGEHKANKTEGANRVFYLAIPPTEFEPALNCIHGIRSAQGWTRVVVEKPFGEDVESAKKLNALVARQFKEDEVYRIDHFMGKETLQNLVPLRFANALYAQMWDRQHVQSIVVNVKESFGLEGRAGYFDASGIVRDMIQNHLLSIVALLTMEEPDSMRDDSLHNAKTKLFQSMKAVVQDDIIVGQYGASPDGKKVAYAADKGVKESTKTPTYVAVVVHIDNERWKGVPILMHCGKALDTTKSEAYVHFTPGRSTLYPTQPPNSLQVDLGHSPSIRQRVNLKSPGIADEPQSVQLRLVGEAETALKAVPVAYERLVLDVVRGARQLFVSAEEVEAAWAVVDPVLKQLEGSKAQPVIYQFGSKGPAVTNGLLSKYHFPHTVETL